MSPRRITAETRRAAPAAFAIIHSAVFPEYPVRGVEETIRFHLRPGASRDLMESFDRFQLAGLALICLKNETMADAARPKTKDLRPKTKEKAHPLELAKYSLERMGASASEMDIQQ